MNELNLIANVENLSEVINFVDENLEQHDCPIKIQMTIDIAVEEVFVNIANYGYPNSIGKVKITFEYISGSPSYIKITFVDSGIPYNPFEKLDPDVSLSAEDRQIGGLGIYMVKKSMDSVQYEYKYKEKNNVLTLTKYLK